jgi:lysozyme
MARRINAEGLKLIKQWEGCVLYAYDDFDPPSKRRKIRSGDVVRGTLTIGYGHTGPDVKPGMTIGQSRADELLIVDLSEYEAAVTQAVHVELTDNQFAALVAFAFNVGKGAFRGSSLVRKLNQGDYSAVPKELMKWTSSKGNTMPGLVNRRSAEAGLWSRGAFVASNTVPTEPEAPTSKTMQKAGVATTAGGVMTSTATSLAGVEVDAVKYVVAVLIIGGLILALWGIFHGEKEEAA